MRWLAVVASMALEGVARRVAAAIAANVTSIVALGVALGVASGVASTIVPGTMPDAAADTIAETVEHHLARVRELYDKRDFTRARDELLAAYKLDPRPELLFALGQVEINIGHFQKAIDYYEQFLASGPAADQAALAQQAIGAARARLTEEPAVVAPSRPPPHREWDVADSGFAAAGATAIVAGAALLTYSHQLAGDRTGKLSAYNHRLSRATITQWTGVGCAAAGALAVAGAMLRWRLHLEDTELQPIAAPRTAGVAWVGRW